jgi:N-acetylglucosamine-6-phosphate deacetylase
MIYDFMFLALSPLSLRFRQFHHRDPGLVGLLTSNEVPADKIVYFGIISDGIHTHGAALRIAHRTHPSGLILVTDAISAMGLEEGMHRIGQYTIEVRDHKAYIAGTTTLCGSIAPMDECVRIFKKETKCSIEFALEAASLHPADCLGISERKGTLNYGADADFILLDDDMRIHSTWIAGECVFETETHSLPKVTSQWTEN